MKCLRKHQQQIHEALQAAYRDKETAHVDLSSSWATDVMRDIRRLGPLTNTLTPFVLFDRLLWQFAAGACAVALMLCVYAGVSGWNPVDAVAEQFLGDPVEFTVAQAFGAYDIYE